ncbi:MAG: outer membrane beta-barrel protein [Bryobacteraceae bacterium]
MKIRSALLLLCAFATVAPAQVGEISLSFGRSLFKNNKLGTELGSTANYQIRDGFHMAARMTLNTKRFVGHEFGYAYNRSHLGLGGARVDDDISVPVHQGFYNFLVYGTPEGSRIRPFAAGGGHFSSFYPPGASVSYGNGITKFGVNYGAGVKVKVTPIFNFRVDIRDYLTPKPFDLVNRSGPLHQVEVSAGVGFMF